MLIDKGKIGFLRPQEGERRDSTPSVGVPAGRRSPVEPLQPRRARGAERWWGHECAGRYCFVWSQGVLSIPGQAKAECVAHNHMIVKLTNEEVKG